MGAGDTTSSRGSRLAGRGSPRSASAHANHTPGTHTLANSTANSPPRDTADDEGKTIGINFFYRPWFHKMGFREDYESKAVIRNEHYVHLAGDRKSARPCPDDEARVCFLEE